MQKILPVILLLSLMVACAPKNGPKLFNPNVEVICVYTPRGIEDGSNAALIYMGILRTTDSLGIACRSVFPFNFADGADSIAQLVANDQPGRQRLIVATDPEYSSYLQDLANAGQITDSDSTQLLVLDGAFRHSDIYTAHICYYGIMYQAGYIASQMKDVDSVQIAVPNSHYLYLREGCDGFIGGFTKEHDNTIDIYDFSELAQDNHSGYLLRQLVYQNQAPYAKEHYDMVLPLCGETQMGYLRYTRDFPGSFYSIGVGQDMSIYSPDVPFSCLEHTDKIISTCVADWAKKRLPHYRRFGLDDGWMELRLSDAYRQDLEPSATEIYNEAIRKEADYVD